MSQRREIFNVADDYRVVCEFGYDSIINLNWYLHLQEKVKFKRFLFFGETKSIWMRKDSRWLSWRINSMDELKREAVSMYEERVVEPQKAIDKAMNL